MAVKWNRNSPYLARNNEVVRLWNIGRTVDEIAAEVHLGRVTVQRKLSEAHNFGVKLLSEVENETLRRRSMVIAA